MRIIRFCDVTDELAKKEGEGDLSLRYWSKGINSSSKEKGVTATQWSLFAEEFELVELL
ncbi:Uncharacterised protein [Serratia fonticola]|uniref:ASCH domain-containing protein n=1 Tax=Serratia fonticola TaxID=47917 RepID=A0A4U9TU45_SERFO|nr:Uncharacterised protein [Serratia fonticola]